ncbi:MAG: hypothetical protein DRQ06_03675, partial [Candidatus Hydrothermota bacterium]
MNALILAIMLVGGLGSGGKGWVNSNNGGGAFIDTLPAINYGDTVFIPDSIPAMPGTTVDVPIYLKNHSALVSAIIFVRKSSDLIIDSAYQDTAISYYWGTNDFGYNNSFNDTIFLILSDCVYNPYTNYLPEGEYTLFHILVTIPDTVPLNTLLRIFVADSGGVLSGILDYTRMADTTDFADKRPVIVKTGSIWVTYTTTPPVVEDIPDTTINEGQELIFSVSAYDPDGDSLTLYAENLPANASFTPVSGDSAVVGTFIFTPDTTQGDSIYRVAFVAEDQYGARDHEDVFIHVLNVVNLPPEFTPIPDTSVKEGDTLVLTVQASDPEGGPVTLSTGALPPNAIFTDNGNGTGTFVFAPDFDQGGDTVLVTFYAADTAGATSSMDVNIEIIDVPYDFLLADTTGGLPGAGGVGLPIWVVAQAPIYGLQFDLAYDNNDLIVDSIVKRDGYPDFVLYHSELAPGTLRVVFMSYSLGTIPAGQQAIMDIYFSIAPGASTGQHPVVPFNAIDVIDI